MPKKWQGGGHLLTNDLEYLHWFAKQLGLKRQWFQNKTFPHYDLTASKRSQAIRADAVEIASGEFPPDLLVKGPNGYETYAQRKQRKTEQ